MTTCGDPTCRETLSRSNSVGPTKAEEETFAGATPARIAHLLAPAMQKKGLLVTNHLRLSQPVISLGLVGQGWLERGSLHALAQTLGAKSRIANRA